MPSNPSAFAWLTRALISSRMKAWRSSDWPVFGLTPMTPGLRLSHSSLWNPVSVLPSAVQGRLPAGCRSRVACDWGSALSGSARHGRGLGGRSPQDDRPHGEDQNEAEGDDR